MKIGAMEVLFYLFLLAWVLAMILCNAAPGNLWLSDAGIGITDWWADFFGF